MSVSFQQKGIGVLRLEEPIDNLYNLVAALPHVNDIDVLFVMGIEKSLTDYIKPGYQGEGDYYNLDTIPRILGHLDLQRERFRDDFDICFVFLVPRFALKYFIRRAPDFFDWRSGVWEFGTDSQIIQQESSRILREASFQHYLALAPQQRTQKILEIQELIDDVHTSSSEHAGLFLELGNLFAAETDYQSAITSYDQVLKFKPDQYKAWNNRANALSELGRYEEAITNYNQSLKLKSDQALAWYNQGNVLSELGRYEEAITSYSQSLKFKSDQALAWHNRGNSLSELGRYEEAITSYDQALKFKPDQDEAWYNHGNALLKLGRYEEAITSYDQALKFKPDQDRVWNNRGNALLKLGRYEEAITSYDQALKFKPDQDEVWTNRGNTLLKLGRYEEAITNCDQALKFKPDLHQAFYNKACGYALQGNVDAAIANLSQAISLNPDHNREIAKTDSDFDAIRDQDSFQALVMT